MSPIIIGEHDREIGGLFGAFLESFWNVFLRRLKMFFGKVIGAFHGLHDDVKII